MHLFVDFYSLLSLIMDKVFIQMKKDNRSLILHTCLPLMVETTLLCGIYNYLCTYRFVF